MGESHESVGSSEEKTGEGIEGWERWWEDSFPLRLGISSCLLGQEVRFDGGHCRNGFALETLGPKAEWVAVCPEMGVGMPSPRPTIRLQENAEGEVRLVEPRSGEDHTDAMREFSRAKLAAVGPERLDGYIVKKSSPSCGLERLPVYRGDHKLHKNGVGIFTHYLRTEYPELPIEEEGRLNDPRLRESFIEQIFCRNRWRKASEAGWTRKRLIDFHMAHKMLLWAHDEKIYRELGGLVGRFGQKPDDEIFAEYGLGFLRCLQIKATTKRHVNVMQHAMGYLKDKLTSHDKKNLNATIEDFREGLVPLVVPLALLRFNIQQHSIEYLMQQLYFDPFPKQWALQNYV